MFTSTYKVQMPRGSMMFTIQFKCRQLNDDDEQLGFNLTDFCHKWWTSEESKHFKQTPHALVLGVWLAISNELKQTSDAQARDLVVQFVELEAPGLTISFGIDK